MQFGDETCWQTSWVRPKLNLSEELSMGGDEVNREIDKLSSLIDSLEDSAGIKEAVNHARNTGAPDKLKEAYYAVADFELRKKLIATTGKLDHLYLKKCELDVSSAREEMSNALDQSNRQPWLLAAATTLTSIVLGQWVYGLVGAIGGAIGGFFLGLWIVSFTKKEESEAIRKANHSLLSALKRNEESKTDPFLFSAAELEVLEREG